MKRRARGLTLVELAAAAAILAVAAAVLTPALGGMLRHLERQVTMARLLSLRTALEGFYSDTGVIPPDPDGTSGPLGPDLRFLFVNLDLDADQIGDVDRWNGPYITHTLTIDPSAARARTALAGTAGISFDADVTPTLAQLAKEAFRVDGWGRPFQAYAWAVAGVPGVVLHSFGADGIRQANPAELVDGTASVLGDDMVETVLAYRREDPAHALETARKMAILNSAWHSHLRARHLVPTVGMSGVYLLRLPGGFRPPRHVGPNGDEDPGHYDGNPATLNDPALGPRGEPPTENFLAFWDWYGGWWPLRQLARDGFLPGGDETAPPPVRDMFYNPNTREIGSYHLWLTRDGLEVPFQYHRGRSTTVAGWRGPNLKITHPSLDAITGLRAP